MKRISDAALVAKELKRRLTKELGLKVIWCRSENYAGGSSVKVEIENPRPEERAAAEALEHEYVMGYFNGMEDIYEIKPNIDDRPRVSFVFITPVFTKEVLEAGLKYATAKKIFNPSWMEPCAHRALAKPEFWEWYDNGCYDSVLEAKMAGDDAAADKMFDAAKAGEVIRLI